MAGIDYGNLTYEPVQFDPRTQDSVFKFNYSYNRPRSYCELVVTDYGIRRYESGFQNMESGTSSGDTTVWYNIFNVAAGEIVPLSSVTDKIPMLYAYVNMSSTLYTGEDGKEHISEDADDLVQTTPIVVNIFNYYENDITWFDPAHPSDASISYGTNTSTCAVGARVSMRTGTGEVNSNIPNTCRFLLYNSNKVLIKTSGELFWKQANERQCTYEFDRLRDGELYYVKFKIRFNGGYIYESNYNTIQVDYSPAGDYSDRLRLTNDAAHGCVIVETNGNIGSHTSVVISRTEASVRDYLRLQMIETTADSIEFRDYYALPNVRYIYQVTIYRGSNIVETLYNEITHSMTGITIADYWGAYSAVAEVNKYPINRNDRGTYIEAMDNKYPYHIINGNTDYESGQVSGLFTEVEDCQIVTNNTEYADILREWLNNGCAKVLKYDTGESWIVTCTGVRTEAFGEGEGTVSTAFNWTQVGDAYNVSHYGEMGLVMNE